MPRKRKPAAKKAPARKSPPRPAGAKAEKGKGGQPAKKKGGSSKHPHPKHPYSRPSWGLPWFEQDKKKKAKKAAPKPAAPTGSADGGTAEPLPPPVEALVEWRKSHPVTPPTFTGHNTGDLGGGPQQTAPGAPPKQNGAPIYTAAPPAQTPYTPTAPEQVSWGQILSDYYASTAGAPAGFLRPEYSTGTPAGQQVIPSPFPIRPDINLETAQQMMNKVSGGFYTGGQA